MIPARAGPANPSPPAMSAPHLSRPIRRGLIALSACLLCAWILSRIPGAAPDTAPLVSTGPRPRAGAREIVPATPPAPPSLRAEATKATDPALADPDSPLATGDLHRNRLWAERHPAVALAWLRRARAGEQRVAVAEVLCAELMPAQPRVALALAENCRDDGDDGATRAAMRNLLDNLAQQWAERDFEAATGWALSKAPGEPRDRLLQRMAFARAGTDPEAAGRLVAKEMSPGHHRDEAAMAVLHQWIQTDAGAALAWIDSFPAGALRERALDEVASLAAAPPESPFSGNHPE